MSDLASSAFGLLATSQLGIVDSPPSAASVMRFLAIICLCLRYSLALRLPRPLRSLLSSAVLSQCLLYTVPAMADVPTKTYVNERSASPLRPPN